MSPDGNLVATGQSDGVVMLWNVSDGSGEPLGSHDRKVVGGIVFSPDGGHLVSADWFGTTKTWDLKRRTMLNHQKQMHMLAIHSLAFSRDGKRLVTACGEPESVKIWDPVTRRELALLTGSGFTNDAVEVSPDGNAILATNVNGEPQLWRVPSWDEIRAVENENGPKKRD